MTRLETYNKFDVFVELLDFKDRPGNGFVVANSDGTYTIFLNTRITFEMQQKTVEHELKHIERNDLWQENPDAQKIEAETHQIEQIIIEQHEEAMKQLEEEPQLVKYEIEVQEKLLDAIAEVGRREIERERHASFSRYMWDNHRDEYFTMLENYKLYNGI